MHDIQIASRHMFTRLCTMLPALLLLPGSALAGGPPVFWLGGGGAPCNFASLSTAIGAIPDGAIIHIANNQTYDDINLVINDKSLRLIGGFADCAGTPSSDPAVLTGQDGATLPVLRIQTGATPREVRMHNLHIRNGTRSGIEIAGAMTVNVSSSIVSDSEAEHGGGINLIGESPASTRLTLYSTVIGHSEAGTEDGNQAGTTGGGIRCSDATLRFSRLQIRGNTSQHSGGGLYADGCQAEQINVITAEGGSQELALSVFEENHGEFFGGGIHARNGSTLTLDSLFEATMIDGNTSRRGAGVFLTGAGTQLSGTRINIIDNTAGDFGAGAFVEAFASLSISRGVSFEGYHGNCAPLAVCSRIAGNVIPGAGTTAGSAVQLLQASLVLDQVEVTDNLTTGPGQATLFFSGDSTVRIFNSLIHGNDSGTGNLVRVDGPDATVNFNSSTLVGNTTGNTLIRLQSGDNQSILGLHNSIVWQPDTTIVSAGDNDIINSVCTNAHENDSMNAQTHDPGFLSPDASDYRLRLDSPNIDACVSPFAGEESFDLLGVERPENLGQTGPSIDGVILVTPYDRGSYELTDLIFANGFEEPTPPI